MSPDALSQLADRILAARRSGTRISLLPDGAPASVAAAFAIQDRVFAGLGCEIAGYKVNEMPDGEVVFAPIPSNGVVPAGGTWAVTGPEPAGIELEIAFRMARDVPADASPSEVMAAVDSANVVFELCQSRLADPDHLPQVVKLADCVLNSGIVVGRAIAGWKAIELKGVVGRLIVDGRALKDGKSADPIRALQILPQALARRGHTLKAGQTVITGSLIGMNWLDGDHELTGVIDGCGEVAMRVARA
ncbi:MAG: hypothetical protein R3D68_08345 [Hyphomicrobiaceae bacterium]